MQPVTTGVDVTIRPLTISAVTEEAPAVHAGECRAAGADAALSTSSIVRTMTAHANTRPDTRRDPIT